MQSFYRNPTDDQVFSYIDQLIDLNEVFYPETRRAKKRNLEPFRISEVIESCHSNKSIYNVMSHHHWHKSTVLLHLHSFFVQQVLNLDNYLEVARIRNLLEDYKILDKINELTTEIKINTGYDILPPETVAGIKNLQNSELKSFDSNKFFDNVSTFEGYLCFRFFLC